MVKLFVILNFHTSNKLPTPLGGVDFGGKLDLEKFSIGKGEKGEKVVPLERKQGGGLKVPFYRDFSLKFRGDWGKKSWD